MRMNTFEHSDVERATPDAATPQTLTIVFEYDGSDCQTLAYGTATLEAVFDAAAWVAHINDVALSDVNVRFSDTVVTPLLTMATDGHRDLPISDDVPF